MSGLTICEYYNNGHCLKYDEDCFNQCVQKQVNEDAISRKGIKIRLGKRFSDDPRRIMEIVKETVDDAPSVIPKPKEGECPYFIDGVWCNLVGKKMKGAE